MRKLLILLGQRPDRGCARTLKPDFLAPSAAIPFVSWVWRARGPNRTQGVEEAEHRVEVGDGEAGEAATGFGFDAFVDALELEQAGGDEVDEEAAAVGGVGLATDVAAL